MFFQKLSNYLELLKIAKKTTKPVFIHINKNAGTSITKSAGQKIIVAGHQTASHWIANHKQEAPLFAVIRNPFDRIVSEYFYRKRRYDGGENNPHLANLHKSFEEWVIATFRDGEFRSSSFFQQTGIPYNHNQMIGDTLIWFISQKQWICDDNGEILVSHLLRYENLNQDWEEFSNKYKINRKLKFYNSSPRNISYHQYYSDQTRQIIEDYFKEDLDTFGYFFC